MKADLQERLKSLSPEQRARLKQMLGRKRSETAAPAGIVSIPPLPPASNHPLSPSQSRLWVIGQLAPEASVAYNVSFACRVRGALDAEALERAFHRLMERFTILRMAFYEREGEPRQSIRSDVEAWRLEKLAADGGSSGHASDDEFRGIAIDFANRPFRLSDEFPLRAGRMSLDNGDHGLVIVMHHIVCDGWSLPILSRWLDCFYGLECRGETDTQPPLAIQYTDYIEWLNRWLNSSEADSQRTYWERELAELPEPLDLHPDYPRPAVRRFEGAHAHFSFAGDWVEALAASGQSTGISLFVTLHASLVALLARWSGRYDFIIGAPAAGRFHPDLTDQIGLFVNTLPLRARVDPEWTLRELLDACRETVLNGFANEGIPFDALMERLEVERDLSRSPLFDVMIGLNDAAGEHLSLGALEVEQIPLGPQTSKVDLTFHFTRKERGLDLDVEYAVALFRPETIERLVQTWRTLVHHWLLAPETALGDVPLLTSVERRSVIEKFNPPTRTFPAHSGVVELFAEQVTRAPNAPAVAFEGGELSYRELDRLADRVAGALMATGGLAKEEPVGVRLERSPRMLAAILGILKAGGCYLPLKSDTPADRERRILEEAKVRFLFLEADDQPPPEWGGRVLNISGVLEKPESDEVLPRRDVSSNDLAYIIFTSGSTGHPKGTLVEQRSVARLVKDTDFLQLGPGDRVLQTGSLAFDASTFEIWGPLLNGGCCCLPEGRSILGIDSFGSLLERFRVDTCFLTTGLFNQIAEFNPTAFASLRNLLTGGEKVSTLHVNRVRAEAPNLRLLHVYGPTENTTFSTWFEVARDYERDIPIGRAIAHSTAYILDERGHPQPPGVPGELYCGGHGVACGYLNDPRLTAEMFVPDPYSHEPAARLYRTGDYAKWNEAGEIVFVGRRDDQVKIRGFRIELSEIENRLRAHSSIEQAIVMARARGGTHELIAYLAGARPVGVPVLREFLSAELPDYMIPARFIFLDALPLNASGKVDRRALPEPSNDADDAVALDLGNPARAALAEIWQTVLGVAVRDERANYFHEGGDSIKAIQLVARLKQRGYELQLRDVFAHPLFGDMAMVPRRVESSDTPVVAACGELPLTPVQRWFLESASPPYDHFNQSTFLRLRERLDPGRVRRALDALIEIHPMLNCRLRGTDAGSWEQAIEEESGAPCFVFEDLRGGAESVEARIKETATALKTGFSLENGPLLAGGLFRLDDGDRLLLVVHHWAVDGISWRVLLEDFEAAYQGLPIPPEPVPFRQWAQALERAAEEEVFGNEKSHWNALAHGIERHLPIPESGRPGGQRGLRLPAGLTTKLVSESGRVCGARIQEVLAAAFLRSWFFVTGRRDLLLAFEGHGREGAVGPIDTSRTVGWFTSIFPVLLELPVEPNDVIDALRLVKDTLRRVPNKGVGFGILRYLGSDAESAKRLDAVRPRVSFNYLGEFGEMESALFAGLATESGGSDTAGHLSAPFGFDVVADVVDGSLRIHLEDHNGLLDSPKLDALEQALKEELHALPDRLRESEPRPSATDYRARDLTLAEVDAISASMEGDVVEICPLTPMQEGMLYHALAEPESGAYCDQVCLRLEGSLDIDAFRHAWAALGERHPHLAGRFLHEGLDRPVLVIGKHSDLGFEVVDGCGWAAHEKETRLTELREGERRRGFDLMSEPALRLLLVRLDESESEAVLGFHHAALDGWSSGILWRELEVLYTANANGNDAPLPPPVAFTRYLEWLQMRDAKQDLHYWTELLDGARGGATVPPGSPRLGTGLLATRSVEWPLDSNRTARLEQWARDHGCTLNHAVQTLWALFLGELNGTRDVVFGVTVSGRNETIPGVESMVGLLINTVPVRVAWEAAESPAKIVLRVAKQQIEGQRHAAVSLAELQSVVATRDPLVSHTLVFENYPLGESGEGESPGPWKVTPVAVHDPMHFEFGVLVVPRSEGLLYRVIADAARYPDHYLKVLERRWQGLVERFLADSIESQPAAEAVWPLTVAATFTADSIGDALGWWANGLGRTLQLEIAPFNQVFQELLNPGSALRRNPDGDKLLLIRLEDWLGTGDDPSSLEKDADRLVDGVRECARLLRGGRIWIGLCPASSAIAEHPEVRAIIDSLAKRLEGRLSSIGRVHVLPLTDLERIYAVSEIEDAEAARLGAIPYRQEYLTALATRFVRARHAVTRSPIKVIALDADNTLWRGIVGEDGPGGVRLTDGHRQLQEAMREQRKAGRLLVLCSKNNPDDVRSAFVAHPEFPLRWEDFSAVRVNWSPKSVNLGDLARELNLGLDSFLFFDDSAMECAEVRAAHPGVVVQQLPSKDAAMVAFLEHCWALDMTGITGEDRRRAERYRDEKKRVALRSESGSFAEFLAGLKLEVTFTQLADEHLERAAQLSRRTNQFNTTTRRRSEADIRLFLEEERRGGLAVSVEDRFGDYGIAGLVLFERGERVLRVDAILLSCRVLGRGVEHAVMRYLGALAEETGSARVWVEAVSSGRNAPVMDFLTRHGHAENGGFAFAVDDLVALDATSDSAMGDISAPDTPKPEAGAPASSSFYQYVADNLRTAAAIEAETRKTFARQSAGSRSRGGMVAPEGNTEIALARIWSEVLGLDAIGRDDHFFALGGHSLKAVMVLSRIAREFGARLPIQALFESPTLASLAARIGQGSLIDWPPIKRLPGSPDFPLSFAQRRLWLMERLRADGPSPFHMTAAFRVAGTLKFDRLESAFRLLIARHESLRTVFFESDNIPRQKIVRDVEWKLDRGGPVAEIAFRDEAQIFARRPFDLKSGRLLRAKVWSIDEAGFGLCICMHHIVSDGWSVSVMAEELSALYANSEAELAPLGIQYRDFADWQRTLLEGTAGDSLGDYWKRLFADVPPPLALATDYPRPAVRGSAGASVSAVLDRPAWSAAEALAKQCECTPFVVILGALETVLARESESSEFVVGTPVSGRSLPELEGQVGFFVNLLPLRASPDLESTFVDHLGAVGRSFNEALDHAAYPFDRLVEDLALPRDTSRSPLFDVLLAFQNNATAELRLGDSAMEAVPLPSMTAQYDLTFNFMETPEGLLLQLEYDTALFRKGRMNRLIARFFTLLKSAAEAPLTPLAALRLLPESEEARLREWERGSRAAERSTETMHGLFAAMAARRPAVSAVIDGEIEWTYRELDAQAERIASGLRAAGVNPGSTIAVGGPRGAAFVAAMLGVLRIGGTYLPLDLTYPSERLVHVLENSACGIAVPVDEVSRVRLQELGLKCVMPSNEYSPGIPDAEPGRTAYLIYTSGSSGRPKGVEISHAAFTTMIGAQIDAFGIEPADRCLWFASCAFDASISEIFLALASGATLVAAPDSIKESTNDFANWIKRRQITVATLPPPFLRAMGQRPLEPLRVLISAGEAAYVEDARHYAHTLTFINAYGPTEAAVCATAFRVSPDEEYSQGIPIGRPLETAITYVLDPRGRRVPIGCVGELCIGGGIVGRGYRGDAALTQARFLADPIGGDASVRCYRTGDLARWRSDGMLEFRGRRDGQVKLRGFRIELGEIEAALRAAPNVTDAAAIMIGKSGQGQLVAYLAGAEINRDAVRRSIAERLPSHMIPGRMIVINELPVTPSGKTDRRALEAISVDGTNKVTPVEGNREKALATAWHTALAGGEIGRESDFFALGGDSIKALGVLGRLREAGWTVPLRSVYQYPRLCDLALQLKVLEETAPEAPGGESVAIPLLPIQDWFLRRHTDSPLHHFNQSVFYRCRDRVDTEALRLAIEALWKHHASLRARFESRAGEWIQEVVSATAGKPVWRVEDFRHFGHADFEGRLDEVVREAQEGFSLERGPLVAYVLFHLPEEDRILCVTHHLVSDWVSHRILLEDIERAYSSIVKDEPILLPPVAAGVGTWVERVKESMANSTPDESRNRYWRRVEERAARIEPLFGATAMPGRYGDVHLADGGLSAEQLRELKICLAGLSKRSSLRDAVLVALGEACAELLARPAIVVQLESHGRQEIFEGIAVDRTVGWFTSLFPFVLETPPGRSRAERLAAVAAELEAVPDEGVSYRPWQLYGSRGSNSNVRSAIGFNYLGAFAEGAKGDHFTLSEIYPPHAIAADFERDHPLDVTAWEAGDGLHLSMASIHSVCPPQLLDQLLKRTLAGLRALEG